MKPVKRNQTPTPVWKNATHFIACGFGSGASPWLPGTMGSVMALPFFYWLQYLQPFQYFLVIVVGFIWGILLCDKTSRDWRVHDHGAIVWDEIIGMWLTLFLIPVSWMTVALGFVLFRLFDIVKPWPIRWVDQKVHGGFGIMLDDVLAGVGANITLQLLWAYIVTG